MRGYRTDTRDATGPFDRALRLHLHLPGERRNAFPLPLGHQVVGSGGGVRPGVPAGTAPEALLCWDPASVALCGIHDSGIRVGDRVLVTGLGAIGLMAAQLARLQGAGWVACSDPIAKRRDLAAAHGADLVVDPTADDMGLTVKLQTGGHGADVSVEASGSYAALHDALRSTAYGGTSPPSPTTPAPSHACTSASRRAAGCWRRASSGPTESRQPFGIHP